MVANAHTVFNLINAGLFFGFIPILVRAVEKLVPESEPSAPSLNPLLDDYYLKEPEAALGQVQGEIVNFMQSVSAIHRDLSRAILDRNDKTIRDLGGIDDQIDARQEHFLRFLGRLGEKRLTSRQQKSLNSYVGVVNLVENLGDLIDHRFQQLGQDLIDLKSVMSKETAQAFAELTKLVEAAFAATIDKMAADSTGSAGRVFEAERKVRKFARESKSALSMRLANRSEERLRIFRIEIDLIECQAQMAYLLAEMAREIES
jgi:phosphate:Na+ symporter